MTPSHPLESSPPSEHVPERDYLQRWQELGYIVVGTFLIWLVFDRAATWLGSLRGEAGLLVCALVIIATLLVERLLFKTGLRQVVERLGLGYPNLRAMRVALLVSLILLAFFPLFSLVSGVQVSLQSDWLWLAFGLFAQHGLAAELLFRGFTFGHLRAGHTFWRATWLSLVPFVAVHLLLLTSLSLPLGPGFD
jgi:membrane protease YdiL (CAAX protease family)